MRAPYHAEHSAVHCSSCRATLCGSSAAAVDSIALIDVNKITGHLDADLAGFYSLSREPAEQATL